MRDTTVRQNRIPHTWEILCTDCNIKIEEAQGVLACPEVAADAELNRSIRMFTLFLEGNTYNSIAYMFNTSGYEVNHNIHKVYQWFRQKCRCNCE